MSHEQETPIVGNYSLNDCLVEWFIIISIFFCIVLCLFFMLSSAIYLSNIFSFSIIHILLYEILLLIVVFQLFHETQRFWNGR